MTRTEEVILIFAFRYALNRGTAAPSIVIGEIMKRIDEINPQFIDQFISDTAHGLRHNLCDRCGINDWACFLNKLLLYRYGKPSIDGFDFRESKMHITKRILRIEAYAKTSGNEYLYMAKELDKDMKFIEVASATGRDTIMVYDKIMGDIRDAAK